MANTWRRVVRTLIQTGGASVIVGIIAAFVTLTAEQATALTGGLTFLLSLIQNTIEDATGHALLIAKPGEAAEGGV